MAKTISITPATINFGTVETSENKIESFIIENTGSENVTINSITSSDNHFLVKKESDIAFKSTITDAGTISNGGYVALQQGSTANEFAHYFTKDSDGNWICYMNCVASNAAIWGTARTVTTKQIIAVIKFQLVGSIFTKVWIRLIENAAIDYYISERQGIVTDSSNNVYVSYGNGYAATAVYLSKIAFDNSAITTVTVMPAGGAYHIYFPMIFTSNHIYIASNDNGTGLLNMKKYSTAMGAPVLTAGKQFNTSNSFCGYWALDGSDLVFSGFYFDGVNYANGIIKVDIALSTQWVKWGYATSATMDWFTEQDRKYLITSRGKIVYDKDDLCFLGNTACTKGAGKFTLNSASSSNIWTIATTAFNPEGSADWRIEVYIKWSALGAHEAICSKYIDATHHWFLKKNATDALYFSDAASTAFVTSGAGVIASTLVTYKIRVQRVSGALSIWVDAGAGYVNQTNLSANGVIVPINAAFRIGKAQDGVSTWYFTGEISLFKIWKTTFDDAGLVYNLDVTNSTNSVTVQTGGGGFLYDMYPAPAVTTGWHSSISVSDDYIYTSGNVIGTLKTGYVSDGSYSAYITRNNKATGAVITANQFDSAVVVTDSFKHCFVDTVANDLKAIGYVTGDVYHGGAIGGVDMAFVGFDLYNLAIKQLESGTITIESKFAPDEYDGYSETITITSDAVGSPHTITLTATGEPFNLDPYNYIVAVDKRIDAICFEHYGSFDFVLDVLAANPHITKYQRELLEIPAGTKLILPIIETSETVVNNLPEFRQ